MRLAGKVVRFDSVGGYGFIAPDGGGDDVFLHVNDLEVEKSQIGPGVRVTFGVDAGERGKFATTVRLADGPEVRSAEAQPPRAATTAEEDYYDVLSGAEFRQLITELLLHIRPALDAEQVLQAREQLTETGRRHGWVDEA